MLWQTSLDVVGCLAQERRLQPEFKTPEVVSSPRWRVTSAQGRIEMTIVRSGFEVVSAELVRLVSEAWMWMILTNAGSPDL